MEHKRVLMIGPFPKPTTGVSLANAVVRNIFMESKDFKVDSINTSLDHFDEQVGSFSFHKLFYNLKFNFAATKVLSNDIVYLTPGQTFFGLAKYTVFIVLATLFRKEIIIHVHGNHLGTEYKNLNGWKRTYFRWLLSKTTKGIVLSKSLRPNLTPFIPDSAIYELHNFAEDYLFEDIQPQKVEKLRLIYLSNLMEEKGILVLLEALARLETNGIPYEAKIAGNIDHTNQELIKDTLAQLEHTTYVGVVNGADKKDFLEWGNIFVLPTFYTMEGQPISILEAMATQNVIVTTAHAGIPDVIQDTVHGFFVEKKNAQSIYDCFVFLHKNLDMVQTIAIANQEYFLENFTRKQFESNLIAIFKA